MLCVCAHMCARVHTCFPGMKFSSIHKILKESVAKKGKNDLYIFYGFMFALIRTS